MNEFENPNVGVQPTPAPQPVAPQPEAQPQLLGYDPQTGAPIYAQPAPQPVAPQPAPQPVITGYDPQTGAPIYAQPAPQPAAPQPVIKGYDPKTGQPIYAEPEPAPVITGYDPKTGQPIYGTPKAPKKKGKAGIIIASVVAAAGLAVGGFFLVKGLVNKNSNRILQAIENTVKAELPSGMQKLDEAGSVTIEADIQKLPIDMTLPVKGTATISVNYKAKKFNVGAKAIGMDLLGLWGSKDEIALKSGVIFGENAYGLSLKNAEKNLKNSWINPANGSESALPQSVYDTVLKILPNLQKALDIDLKKFYENFKSAIWKSLDGMKAETYGNEKVTVLEKDYNANLTKVVLKGEQIVTLAEDLVNWLDKDAEFAKLRPLIDNVLPLVSGSSVKGLGTSLPKVSNVDELLNTLREGLKGLKDQDQVKRTTVTLNGYIDKATNKLVRLEAIITLASQTEGEAPMGVAKFRIDIRSEKDSLKVVTFGGDEEKMEQVAELNWNKSSGAFKATIGMDGEPQSIEGTVMINDKDSMTISNLKAHILDAYGDDKDVDLSFMTVKISGKAENVTIPAYTDLLTMSEEDLQGLLSKISSLLGGLLGGSDY